MFDALMKWVEDGRAPRHPTAVRTENGDLTQARPLCEYPRVAGYKGSGSTAVASNFQCKWNF